MTSTYQQQPEESKEEIYALSRVTEADLPELFTLWQISFASSRWHTLSFPPTIDPVALEKWYIGRGTSLLSKPGVQSFKMTDRRTGQIVACSRWGFPSAQAGNANANANVDVTDEGKEGEGDEATKKKDVALVGMNERLFDEVGETLNKWREKYVKWEDTYVAYLLMTHPDHQRKGLARRLLKDVLDKADAEGRDAYIEASPEGYPVYIKSGFVEVDRVTISLEQHGGHPGEEETSVCLVRKPVAVKV